MAESEDVLPCRFLWHILNLSVPWTNMEASFYNGSPTQPHQWQVNFMPRDRQANFWPFSFCLANVRYGELDDVVLAEQLWITVLVNGSEVKRVVERNYCFYVGNRYTYQFMGNLYVSSEDVTQHVTIKIQLALHDRMDQTDQPDFCKRLDLVQLSGDLMRLLRSYNHFNLKLSTIDPIPRVVPVLSYMMRSRWSNFFSEHPVHTITNNTVKVNISFSRLWPLLNYLYSGNFEVGSHLLRDIEFATELFQVIDRYKMHHLYKVFVLDESRQARWSLKNLQTDSTNIQVDGPPPDGRTLTWTTDPNIHHVTHIQLRLYLNNDDPSFSYFLHKDSDYRVVVHVKIELQTKPEEGRSRFCTVHLRDYTIDGDGTAESGICHFEGDPRCISEFMDGIRGRRGGGTRHFLRCTLYASDGTTGIMIQSQGIIRLERSLRIYKVLSDHMYELLMAEIEPDLTLSCPVERPVSFRLHKGIFASRVPYWSSVLDTTEEDVELPDEVTCSLESEAFRLLRIYIYSGRLLPIPTGYLDEIEEFALQGGMDYLIQYTRHKRKARIL